MPAAKVVRAAAAAGAETAQGNHTGRAAPRMGGAVSPEDPPGVGRFQARATLP